MQLQDIASSAKVKFPPLPRTWMPLNSENEQCPSGCVREEDMQEEYNKRMDSYARAICDYGSAGGKDTQKKANRVVEFACELPTQKNVYIDAKKERWNEVSVRTPSIRSDRVHARRLAHQREDSFSWFEEMIAGARPFCVAMRCGLGDLKQDSAQELDGRLSQVDRAKAHLPPAILLKAPSSDGRIEVCIIMAQVPTSEQLSQFFSVLPNSRALDTQRFHKSAFQRELRRWAMASTHLPEDGELRGKWEAVLHGHHQATSNVPRRVQKICKEQTSCRFSSPPRRPKNPKTGLPAVGMTTVNIEFPDEDVPLPGFDYFDGISCWERWPDLLKAWSDESPPVAN